MHARMKIYTLCTAGYPLGDLTVKYEMYVYAYVCFPERADEASGVDRFMTGLIGERWEQL